LIPQTILLFQQLFDSESPTRSIAMSAALESAVKWLFIDNPKKVEAMQEQVHNAQIEVVDQLNQSVVSAKQQEYVVLQTKCDELEKQNTQLKSQNKLLCWFMATGLLIALVLGKFGSDAFSCMQLEHENAFSRMQLEHENAFSRMQLEHENAFSRMQLEHENAFSRMEKKMEFLIPKFESSQVKQLIQELASKDKIHAREIEAHKDELKRMQLEHENEINRRLLYLGGFALSGPFWFP
jgi:hypothetical protein